MSIAGEKTAFIVLGFRGGDDIYWLRIWIESVVCFIVLFQSFFRLKQNVMTFEIYLKVKFNLKLLSVLSKYFLKLKVYLENNCIDLWKKLGIGKNKISYFPFGF